MQTVRGNKMTTLDTLATIKLMIEKEIDLTPDSRDYDTSLYNGAYKDGLYRVISIIEDFM